MDVVAVNYIIQIIIFKISGENPIIYDPPYMAIYINWQCMARYDHIESYMNIYGQFIYMAIYSHMWPCIGLILGLSDSKSGALTTAMSDEHEI